MKNALLLALALTGCAASVQPVQPPGCDLVVSLAPELAADGAAAVERINAATGCQLRVAPEGVPVSVGEDLEADGEPSCAQTAIARHEDGTFVEVEWVQVDLEREGCMSAEASLVHEFFHAMIGVKHTHASDGVFHAKVGHGDRINAATLEKVCAHVACPSFAPED